MQAMRQCGSAATASRAASRSAMRRRASGSGGARATATTRGTRGCSRRRRAGRGLESRGPHPPSRERHEAGAAASLGPLGEGHLGGRRERQRDVAGRRIPVARVDLEAAQDDLLQPRRRRRHDGARRQRVAVEAPAKLGDRLRVAERQPPRGELVENGAEREDIRARIAAHALHLLGRHVDPVADRDAQFLGEQIRDSGRGARGRNRSAPLRRSDETPRSSA